MKQAFIVFSEEDIARVCHEANRALCRALGEDQPAWDDAPMWQKSSAIEGVKKHMLAALTPEQSHEAWMEAKLRDGWRYGEVKDADKREHPCMVPYGELPAEQRAKDHIFGSIVATIRAVQAERLGDGVAGDRATA